MELHLQLVYTPKVLEAKEVTEMRDVHDIPILATAILESIDVL